MVYAKCEKEEKISLWDDIYILVDSSFPWLVRGDFKALLNEEEKIGGLPVRQHELEDFAFRVNSCELEEISFKVSPSTWWNRRAGDDCFLERLDRMFNNPWLREWFPKIEVEHLLRNVSNHAPLFLTMDIREISSIRPFKFLTFWTEDIALKKVVKQC